MSRTFIAYDVINSIYTAVPTATAAPDPATATTAAATATTVAPAAYLVRVSNTTGTATVLYMIR